MHQVVQVAVELEKNFWDAILREHSKKEACCTACMKLTTLLEDETLPSEEREELQAQLDAHFETAMAARREMRKEIKEKQKAWNDPEPVGDAVLLVGAR